VRRQQHIRGAGTVYYLLTAVFFLFGILGSESRLIRTPYLVACAAE
jgi:hypothetical protein